MTVDAKFDRFWASFVDLVEKLAHKEGLPVRPKGPAATAAYRQLAATGKISSSDVVLVAGPDSAVEYANQSATEPALTDEIDHRGIRLPARHRAGGIITPQ